jgi:hypothetical protein
MPVNKKKIERHILEKTADEWYENHLKLKDKFDYNVRSARQALFDANYTKKL